MKIFLPVLFALCTAMCWGMYGPTIGNAQSKSWSPFKPYVFIGIAYLVLAIIGGLIAMRLKGDTFSYTGEHFAPAKWGFLAGCLGALGALFLTSAMMTSKGNALLVMPIVFGGAVSVTALYSTWRLWGHVQISPVLWVGIAMVAVGVILVATNTPHGHAAAKPAPAAGAVEHGGSEQPGPADDGADSAASEATPELDPNS
ncbi:hypothetical protein [Rosistilla oblonga]|uniref:hypothetical protein n=1 Tax=Rosistilla oblonga TaxID=2527990 RepID=UPI003A97E3BC